MRIIYTVGVALLATMIGLAGPAAAQKVCKDYVTAAGSAAFTKGGARRKARAAWAAAVTARYGEFYNVWDNAEDASDDANCGKAYRVMNRCEARAKPCKNSAGGPDTEAATCQSIGRVPRIGGCDDVIVEVQTKLKELGYSPGTIDGDIGGRRSNTRNAIRKFQKDKGLARTGEPNEATLKELNIAV